MNEKNRGAVEKRCNMKCLSFFNIGAHAKGDSERKGPCAHLVAVHHEVVRGDERFEDHDPAAAGGALQQRVCQVGDADVQLIGAVNQVWGGVKAQMQRKCSAACPHNRD